MDDPVSMETLSRTFSLQQLRNNWGWILALGIGLVALGLLAFGSIIGTTVVAVGLLGVLVLVAGIFSIIFAFTSGSWGVGALRALVGVLFLLAGWILLTRPVVGALTLTILMSWYFILSGIFKMVGAALERHERWGWTLAFGAITFLLGIFLLVHWPVTGLYAIGLFVAIDLVLTGISAIVTAFSLHSLPDFGAPTRPAPSPV
jgi:uncharacterized membrane protein HdeD (DUF308 family)